LDLFRTLGRPGPDLPEGGGYKAACLHDEKLLPSGADNQSFRTLALKKKARGYQGSKDGKKHGAPPWFL
jgi:hypothetical protein